MRIPPTARWAIACLHFTFYWITSSLLSGDPLITLLITASYCLAIRDAGFSRATCFLL